jgi:hypothetical protein
MSIHQRHSQTEGARLARLNRKLAHQDTIIRKCRRDSRDYLTLGDYYAVGIYNKHPG